MVTNICALARNEKGTPFGVPFFYNVDWYVCVLFLSRHGRGSGDHAGLIGFAGDFGVREVFLVDV